MQNTGFFARLANLWRGFWGQTITGAEARNAGAVYHNAIEQRAEQLNELKEAVGRLVYLRNRVEADSQRTADDLQLVQASLGRAVDNAEDAKALALIRKKKTLTGEVERLAGEYSRLSAQVESSKEGLRELGTAIDHLRREQSEMLARRANAQARMEVNSALQHSRGNFAHLDSALESVRESIVRLESSADLEDVAHRGESFEESGEVSMAHLRRASLDDEALDELARMRAARTRLLPERPVSESVTVEASINDNRAEAVPAHV